MGDLKGHRLNVGPNHTLYAGFATIAGGRENTISSNSSYSAIGGGLINGIGDNSEHSTIPGGSNNDIGDGAPFALAAGRRAKANHQGAFVWADSQNTDFTSTANNQFLIRAAGGVGIGTTSTANLIDVAGGANCDGTTWNDVSDVNAKENFEPVDAA